MLVVGAGPVGLTAAHELARRGVAVRIIDKADAPAVTSRATATHARTLEIYHQMGVIDDLLPRGQRVEHFTIHQRGRQLIRFDTDYSALPTRYPFTLMVDQVITEEVLRENLRNLGVEVQWGVELDLIQPYDSSVSCRLRYAHGQHEEVTFPWVIGADGGHSTVRKQLGLPLIGDSTETWLLADVFIDGGLARDSNHLMNVAGGSVLAVPFPAANKWRLVDTVDTDHAEDPTAVGQRFAHKVSHALGREVKISTPSWVSVFTIQQRMVPEMRVGRCFVAGDAAHVHSPASGQGMNTGIQDAYNLAWKLADVIRGHAPETLLDTYAAERVPVGAKLLESTKTATTLVGLRKAIMPIVLPIGLGFLRTVKPIKRKVQRKIMRAMSGLALEYSDSPLSHSSGLLKAGSRVGCADHYADRHSPGWDDLWAELADPRWVLLASEPQPAVEEMLQPYRDAISLRTISRAGTDGFAPIADPDAEVRSRLGLLHGHCALIRPDGYLAAMGHGSKVEEWLHQFFLAPQTTSRSLHAHH